MTIKSGTNQACAACKYQRRRCTSECLLAPFFPADDPKMFQNVHRLFGVKNIQNLLKELPPHQKPEAINSIKYHAFMRDKYPVLGCLVEIQKLTYCIHMAEKELHNSMHQLSYYKQQELSPTDEYMSELQLGTSPPGDPLNQAALMIHVSYSNNGNVDYCLNYLDFKEDNNTTCSSSNENSPSNVMCQNVMSQSACLQQENNHLDFNHFDHIDDTQSSYIGYREAYESSLESPLRDSRLLEERFDENELKNAAACFSLTSVN